MMSYHTASARSGRLFPPIQWRDAVIWVVDIAVQRLDSRLRLDRRLKIPSIAAKVLSTGIVNTAPFSIAPSGDHQTHYLVFNLRDDWTDGPAGKYLYGDVSAAAHNFKSSLFIN